MVKFPGIYYYSINDVTKVFSCFIFYAVINQELTFCDCTEYLSLVDYNVSQDFIGLFIIEQNKFSEPIIMCHVPGFYWLVYYKAKQIQRAEYNVSRSRVLLACLL